MPSKNLVRAAHPLRGRLTPTILTGLVLIGSSTSGEIPRAKDAPQPLSPAQSAACVQLPPGFKLELVACEPVIEEPSCVAFDEWGRTFVCELHGYNVEGEIDVAELNKTAKLDKTVRRIRWELQGGEIAQQAAARQYGKLKLLIDQNGDGQMDRAEVWADDLPPCYGSIAARGGIIVVCAPDIVFFADRDLDGKPDVREILFTGFHTEVLERGINNPRWGLDNWIYVGSGGSGGTITGPHLKQSVPLGRSDFRIRADGTAIEPVHGTVGTFGMTVNDYGDRFPASGGQPATYALPLPYRFLARNPHVPTPRSTHSAANYNRGHRASQPHPWRVQRRRDPAWIKFYGERETDSSYFSGGCSNEFYDDDLFPAEYRGSLFYCEPSLNIVHRCVLSRDGLRYQARRAAAELDSEFLASTDQWFRPMNLRVGPHGELYIVDMYREIIEDYSAIPRFLQQQYGLDQGRDHGRLWRLTRDGAPPAAIPKLANFDGTQLVAELNSGVWRRRTAQRLLVERHDLSVVEDLEVLQRDAARPHAAIAALYTLDGLSVLQPSHVKLALKHHDGRVRMHGIRLSHAWLDQDAELRKQVINGASDSSVVVQAEAAMALGATISRDAQQALVSLLEASADDDWLEAAALSSAPHHASGMLRMLLQRSDEAIAVSSALQPLAATVAADETSAALSELLKLISTHTASIQGEVLDGLISSATTTAAAEGSSLRPLLDSSDPAVRRKAVRLALKWGLRDTPILRERFAMQAVVARDRSAELSARTAALQMLSGAPWDLVVEVKAACLDASQQLEIQRAVIVLLGASDEDERVTAALVQNWQQFSPEIRKAVLAAVFSRPSRIPALWERIDRGEVSVDDLSPSQQEQLARRLNDPQTKRWRALLSPIEEASMENRLKRYSQALSQGGNLDRGKAVFEKTCAQCHRVGNLGHQVGPELGTIAGKPDQAVLAEILNPNARIDPEYRGYTVVTKDGRSFSGILASESATSVVLLREKAESTSVLRREIDTIYASNVSLMPANLHEAITPQEAADLMTFLRSKVTQAAEQE